MSPSRRTGRLCPWFWPISWRAAHKPRLPTGPFLCLVQPKCRRFFRKFLQFCVLGFLVIILVLWLGMVYERAQVRKLPNTEALYTVPQVCAITYNESAVTAKTFANASQVEQFVRTEDLALDTNASTFIAHCGECGNCSTPHDIAIYDQTRNTLFEQSILCAKHGIVGGHRGASRCMKERVGMTSGCNKCWVDNIMCDLRKCIFSCLLHAIFSKGVHDGSSSQELNRCTQCDEIRCGPAFLQCAGANRRRTAIMSDIERDVDVEVCSDVQTGWWQDQELQAVWQKEYGEPVVEKKRRRKRQGRIRQKREQRFNATRL